ncbi:MAG: DNA repair protein RecO [Cycloclasticus sp.]|nr:DNA repair protein RecO [Cycloclasticus sp.]
MNRVEQQNCFILKSQAYKETSSIHQVFTRDYGVISVISKGSRAKNSKNGSLLQSFRPLLFSWVGKGELKTLTAVEESFSIGQLKAIPLYCGFYVNELMMSLLHKHDAHPVLFKSFETVIVQLSEANNIEANLRQFEKALLDETGYGLALDNEALTGLAISTDQHYVYRPGEGALLENNAAHPDAISGSALINLRLNQLTDKNELAQVKRLMRKLIDVQLDGKMLKSREFFK